MLDEKDLQAIANLIDVKMDAKLAAQKNEIMGETQALLDTKLAAQKTEIMGEVQVLMESQFQPQFNLLAEGQQAILEKLVPRSRVDDLEDEVKFLKSMVRRLDEDMQSLKQAN